MAPEVANNCVYTHPTIAGLAEFLSTLVQKKHHSRTSVTKGSSQNDTSVAKVLSDKYLGLVANMEIGIGFHPLSRCLKDRGLRTWTMMTSGGEIASLIELRPLAIAVSQATDGGIPEMQTIGKRV